tara:strand:- start:431 stop:673 length:243 start_codon:yes stop_codon:yes gene_type:complete
MEIEKRNFKVGDLLVNRTAKILFSKDFDMTWYGLIYIDIKIGEIVVVLEVTRFHVTVQTERGGIGWQSAACFDLIYTDEL